MDADADCVAALLARNSPPKVRMPECPSSLDKAYTEHGWDKAIDAVRAALAAAGVEVEVALDQRETPASNPDNGSDGSIPSATILPVPRAGGLEGAYSLLNSMGSDHRWAAGALKEAMDEITRLRAENAQLRTGVDRIAVEVKELRAEYDAAEKDRTARFRDIRKWGRDRQIIQNSTAKAQFLKTVEEVGELASALAKGRIVDAIDAIGDVVVTLTLVAACEDLDIEDCIEAAWQTIKDRKGHLTPDGVFVKEGS